MNEIIKNILSTIRYATISTVDDNGKAWAAPVWYVFDETNMLLCWWSPINSQHSQNIERNDEVYITIFNSTTPEGEGLGLYIRANAKKVPDDKLDKVIDLYNSTTTQFKLNRENTTNNAPTRLYQADPITIQINDGIETDGFYQDIRRDVA
ncbi:MAG: pyridoxamine 5'-phosphate oxidase family protein [Candidatus Saccharimonadales bacterium]